MKRLLPKSEYARNSVISILGVGVASAIPILLQPILGRMYTPEEFNTMGLFVTTVSILSVVANLRYAQAVAVADTDEQARNILIGSFWLSAFFSLLLFILLLGFFNQFCFWLDVPVQSAFWLWLVPLSTFFMSASVGLNSWLNRKKYFKGMAYNKSIRRGGEGFLQVLFGKLKIFGGLTWGTFAGDFINMFVHLIQFRKSEGNFRKFNLLSLKSELKKYGHFPKHNLIPALLDTASLYLPFIFVNSFFDDDTSGQFFQCTNVLALPLALISMAISQVLLQKLTENKQKNKPVLSIILRHFWVLAAMAIVGIVTFFFFGEELFILFLGNQWEYAGQMSSLLVFAYAMKFTITPLSVIFFSHQKLKTVSYWQYLRFAVVLAVCSLSGHDIMTFIILNVCTEVILYLIYLYMIVYLANNYDNNLNPQNLKND
ncbi:MAG: lipopolysaccharide biosynthesis protein [Crocinitomicaceae bacterium]|nr:lipopolysaccharide biosynthesis protein [Crocinitomicaceae bacterium]